MQMHICSRDVDDGDAANGCVVALVRILRALLRDGTTGCGGKSACTRGKSSSRRTEAKDDIENIITVLKDVSSAMSPRLGDAYIIYFCVAWLFRRRRGATSLLSVVFGTTLVDVRKRRTTLISIVYL